MKMKVYCCGCGTDVEARLTSGAEIYPHRTDLAKLPFWICDACLNYVGCHHKTENPTNPLGNIPTKEIRNARNHIHRILDPIWRSGRLNRKALYARLTRKLGWTYHTGSIKSVDEAREVYRAIKEIAKDV